MSQSISRTPNLLLQMLSDEDWKMLQPHLARVGMEVGKVLVEPDMPIEFVHFLEGGIGSIVSTSEEGEKTEIGIFGREGASGMSLLHSTDRSPYSAFMQVDGGTALRVEMQKFCAVVDESSTFRHLLLRYTEALAIQVGQTVVANAHHQMESRLARWLLMCHDRVDGDTIAITHQFMAMMIGAQRTGVTVTLHILEGVGMIRATRGQVIILNREKLEEAAGDNYGKSEAEYRRLVGPFGRSVGLG